MVTMEMFLAAEGRLSPQEFVDQSAETLVEYALANPELGPPFRRYLRGLLQRRTLRKKA